MKAFNNILVQINTEDPSDNSLECAAAMAQRWNANLTAIDVIPTNPWPLSLMTSGIEHAIDEITSAKQKRLERLLEDVSRHGITAQCRVVRGPSSNAIVRLVEDEKFDLVVRRPKGVRSRLSGVFGTTATKLIRQCKCPLLFPQAGQSWRMDRVAAAVKITTDSDVHTQLNHRILSLAQALARQPGEFDAVASWSLYWTDIMKNHMPESEYKFVVGRDERRYRQALDELVAKYELPVARSHLICGEAINVLPKFARDNSIDLLVLGSMGRSGLAGFVTGNTAEQFMSQSSCSVLVIHPQDPVRILATDERLEEPQTVN